MKFFTEKVYTLTDLPSLKKQMRHFAMALHPDRGGKDEDFNSMKDEYDYICETLSVDGKYEATNTSEKASTKTPAEKPSESAKEKPPETNKEKQTYYTHSYHNNQFDGDIRLEVRDNPWGAIAIWYIMFLISISIWFLGWRYHLVSLFCVLGSMGFLYMKGKDAYGHWLTFFLLSYTLVVASKGGYSSVDDWLPDFVTILIISPLFWFYSMYLRWE